MTTPKVSVIILNWNGKDDTLECLKSLESVAYSNLEVIVVDNGGSTDGSQEAVRRQFPSVILMEVSGNRGFAGGNNVAIAKASGDYYFLLNNDTVVDKNVIAELVRVAESDKTVGIAGPKMYFYDRKNVFWFAGGFMQKHYGTLHRGYNEEDHEQYDKIEDVDLISGCALLIKRGVVEKIGLLDEEFFLYYEDADWCLRAKKAGYRVVYVPGAKIWHKCSGTTNKDRESASFHTEKNILLLARKNNFGLLFYLLDAMHLAKFLATCLLQRRFKDMKGALRGKLWYIRNKVL